MDRASFEAAFERIRAGGYSYGDGPSRPTHMQGPGRSSGIHGATDSVYFHDPSGHLLEILTCDGHYLSSAAPTGCAIAATLGRIAAMDSRPWLPAATGYQSDGTRRNPA